MSDRKHQKYLIGGDGVKTAFPEAVETGMASCGLEDETVQ